VGYEIEREVEGRDRHHHTDRAPEIEAEVAFPRRDGIQRQCFPVQPLGFFGRNRECRNGPVDLGPGEFKGFAGFGGYRSSKVIPPVSDQRSRTQQDLGFAVGRHARHDSGGLVGGADRRVHFLLPGGRNGRDHLAGVFVRHLQRRARLQPLTVNQQLVFHQRTLRGNPSMSIGPFVCRRSSKL